MESRGYQLRTAVVVTAVVAAAVSLVVLTQGDAPTTSPWYALPRLVAALVVLAGARWWASGRRGDVARGLVLGWPALGVAGLALWSSRPDLAGADGSALAWFTASMLAVGLFEEVLTRGFALGVFLRSWAGQPLAAAAASSVVFGLAHLVNVPRAGWVPTLVQVVYATLMGLFFAGVRLRSGSLAAVVGLHALLDWSFYVGGDVARGTASGGGSGMIVLVIGAVLGGYGLLLLRKGVG